MYYKELNSGIYMNAQLPSNWTLFIHHFLKLEKKEAPTFQRYISHYFSSIPTTTKFLLFIIKYN